MSSHTHDDNSTAMPSEQNPTTEKEGTHMRNELGLDHEQLSGGDKTSTGFGNSQGARVQKTEFMNKDRVQRNSSLYFTHYYVPNTMLNVSMYYPIYCSHQSDERSENCILT